MTGQITHSHLKNIVEFFCVIYKPPLFFSLYKIHKKTKEKEKKDKRRKNPTIEGERERERKRKRDTKRLEEPKNIIQRHFII